MLRFTSNGIYCKQGDFYIDPWKPVPKALITHAHSDHARFGNQKYIAVKSSKQILKYRLGEDLNLSSIEYGEPININGVKVSFHPAGHIIGSGQIRTEYKGEVWVVTGDYKIEEDGVSETYEQLKCNTLITECTFGLPAFNWKPQAEIFNEINAWWQKNAAEGKASLLTAYSLGKAQRILKYLDRSIGPIYSHGAIHNTNEVLQPQLGFNLETILVTKENKKADFRKALIIAPPSAVNSTWTNTLKSFSLGIASGWMALRGARRRRAADRGFVLSDHADWKELNQAIKNSGAETIITTHGYTDIFTKWLQEQGYNAFQEKTLFDPESGE